MQVKNQFILIGCCLYILVFWISSYFGLRAKNADVCLQKRHSTVDSSYKPENLAAVSIRSRLIALAADRVLACAARQTTGSATRNRTRDTESYWPRRWQG